MSALKYWDSVTGTWVTVGSVAGANPIDAWPIGSIFLSAVSTNPATLLGGGTWARFGQGKMLVSQDSGDTDFDTAEETGGAKTVTLAIANLPSHDHTMAHTHSLSAHTHAGAAHTHSLSAHTHTLGHTHAMGNHTHGPGTLGTDTEPAMSHSMTDGGSALSTGTATRAWSGSGNFGGTSIVAHPAHSHAVTTGATAVPSTNTTGPESVGTTTAASPDVTGAASATITGAPSSDVTGASSAANTGTAGSGTAVNVMNPYIVVYMWKRTA